MSASLGFGFSFSLLITDEKGGYSASWLGPLQLHDVSKSVLLTSIDPFTEGLLMSRKPDCAPRCLQSLGSPSTAVLCSVVFLTPNASTRRCKHVPLTRNHMEYVRDAFVNGERVYTASPQGQSTVL